MTRRPRAWNPPPSWPTKPWPPVTEYPPERPTIVEPSAPLPLPEGHTTEPSRDELLERFRELGRQWREPPLPVAPAPIAPDQGERHPMWWLPLVNGVVWLLALLVGLTVEGFDVAPVSMCVATIASSFGTAWILRGWRRPATQDLEAEVARLRSQLAERGGHRG
jgi:hypothetical protein